jgi:Zn-dependent M28 family amino/carboxypeptidase
LLFLDVGNASPGAIDNASSVGLVLHLAECLVQRHDLRDKLHVTILISSAEEMMVMGTAAFVKAHERQLRRQSWLSILNFDGIGVDGDLYWAGRSSSRLIRHIRQACDDRRLPLRRFRFVGAMFDHIPFAQHGFDAVTLMAIGRASRSIHTPGDSIDKLHIRGFDQAGQVTLRIIEQMANELPQHQAPDGLQK